MDIGRSFTFMFDDEEWIKKILIGGILFIIPIVNFVVFGYFIDTLKNVIDGQELPLPELDFGDQFVKGLMSFLACLIYAIPAIVLSIMVAVVTAVLGGAGDEAAQGVAGLCALGGNCIIFLYALVMAVILPSACILYANSGEFGAFFRFGEIIGLITSNIGGYVVAILIAWVASMIAAIVGSIACGVGLFFTSFWAYLVAAHLFGQFYTRTQTETV
jgi:hypothetical protein